MARSTLKTRGLQWYPDPRRGPGVLGWDTGKSAGAFCFLYLEDVPGEDRGYIWQRAQYDISEIAQIHWHIRDAVEVCVIEKVNIIPDMHDGQGKKRSKGKKAQFVQGYELALPVTLCHALEIPFVEVQGRAWQEGLGIYVKGEDYVERKARYSALAKADPLADRIGEKVTNGNSDGLLIAKHALQVMKEIRNGQVQ
jgi:hypothetical protein